MRWGAVPILKIKAQDDTKCDICINNYLGRANSNMLRLYATFDPRLHKLGLFMKMWAKTLEIGESGHSGLNSYTFIIMCIAYMQSRNMLPNLQDETLCASLERKQIGTFDCTYMQDLEQVPWKITDNTSLHELIAGFMRWLLEFDFNKSAISIRCGGSVPFKEEKTLAIIHVEDPFELRDLGASMSPAKFLKLREELLKAYVIITGDSSYVPPEVVNSRLSQWLKKNKTK
jgi:DNA polymerase sigma